MVKTDDLENMIKISRDTADNLREQNMMLMRQLCAQKDLLSKQERKSEMTIQRLQRQLEEMKNKFKSVISRSHLSTFPSTTDDTHRTVATKGNRPLHSNVQVSNIVSNTGHQEGTPVFHTAPIERSLAHQGVELSKLSDLTF